MSEHDDLLQRHDDFVSANHGRLKTALIALRETLLEERQETREMLEIYFRFTQGQATAEEMHHANRQFAELIRYMGLGVLLILPMAPVSIPLIVKLGRRLGIDVLPNTTRKGHTPLE
jgi:hypothetical protein